MMRIMRTLVIVLALLAAGCGGSSGTDEVEPDAPTTSTDGVATTADEVSGDSGGGDLEDETADEPDDVQEETVGDTEDAAEITGNDDLDLDELAEISPDAADALDGIDDIVSIGDCSSEVVGLAMTYVPVGHECRVLDQSIGGLDGFTLFEPGATGGLEITIGTPSPIPVGCELLQACDTEMPLDVGDDFTMFTASIAGIPLIYGTHDIVDAEVSVTTFAVLTDEQVTLLDMVLDGVEEL